MFCRNFAKTVQKRYYFQQDLQKAKKWPNGQIILFLANCFKKGQIKLIWPNGNSDSRRTGCGKERGVRGVGDKLERKGESRWRIIVLTLLI